MLTESKRLNIAIILLAIVNLISTIIGILYTILGFMPYHQTSIGMSPSKIRSFNPALMDFIYIIIRVNGFLFLNVGITGIYILFVGFRKKEKWAWIYNLFPTFLVTLPLVVILYNEKFAMPFPLALITFVMTLIALGISYKEFFE